MGAQIVSYSQFPPLELAHQLHDAVRGNEQLLRTRNLQGVVDRYGASPELAEQNVRRGQINNGAGETRHYAVVDGTGDVVGAASIYPGLPLSRLRLPIPSALAIPPLVEKFPYANPNIHAWATVGEEEVLAGAYKLLADIVTSRADIEPVDVAWTIEPRRSPRTIHAALSMAGLTRVATRLFSDDESRRRAPRPSVLYVQTGGDWATTHGRLKTVRHGRARSGWQIFMIEVDRAMQNNGY